MLTTIGDKNPLIVAKKFMIPKALPAYMGDKSCAFAALVNVEAPLKPRARVINKMQISGLFSTRQNPSKITPGIMWAKENSKVI